MTHGQRLATRRQALQLCGAGMIGSLAGCVDALSLRDEPNDTVEEDDGEADPEPPEYDLPLTGTPTIVDLAEQDYHSTLRTISSKHQLVTPEAEGGETALPEVWAFAADDRAPSVPGPIYRVEEGATVEHTYANDHHHPHTLHVHAVTLSWADDGAATTGGMPSIDPGDAQTYTIEADVPGTHLYHCHVQTDTHLDMGMYGIFHVVPEDRDPVDREYFLTLRDWDSRLHRSQAGEDVRYRTDQRDPDVFTINGRSAPSTFHPDLGSPLLVDEDECVRVHLVNAGYQTHPFHTHRHRFTVIAQDGSPIPTASRYEQDVVDVALAQRYTIEFTADNDPGIYPAHCHKVDHVTTNGRYPGGMATAIVYEETMDSEGFEDLMAKAGYEA